MKDDEFLFFWIDSIVDKIQYGARTKLCGDLKLKAKINNSHTLLIWQNKIQLMIMVHFTLKMKHLLYK